MCSAPSTHSSPGLCSCGHLHRPVLFMTLHICSKGTVSFADCSCPRRSGCRWGFPAGPHAATSFHSIFHVFCMVLPLSRFHVVLPQPIYSFNSSAMSTYYASDTVQGPGMLRQMRHKFLRSFQVMGEDWQVICCAGFGPLASLFLFFLIIKCFYCRKIHEKEI